MKKAIETGSEWGKCVWYTVSLGNWFERDKSVWVIKPIQLSTTKQHAIGIAEAQRNPSQLCRRCSE